MNLELIVLCLLVGDEDGILVTDTMAQPLDALIRGGFAKQYGDVVRATKTGVDAYIGINRALLHIIQGRFVPHD